MQLQILSREFFNFSSMKSLEHAVIAIQGINKINSSSFQAKSQFGAVANAPAHFGLRPRVLAAAVRLGRVFFVGLVRRCGAKFCTEIYVG